MWFNGMFITSFLMLELILKKEVDITGFESKYYKRLIVSKVSNNQCCCSTYVCIIRYHVIRLLISNP